MSDGTITCYIATSVDGYVADDDGGVGWLDEFEEDTATETADAYETFFGDVDCLVMGATTYEQILTFGAWPYEDRPTYVFTHGAPPRATETVEFVDGEVEAVAADLRETYEHLWLVGGAQIAGAFLRAGQIDELRLSLVPVLLGSGVELFGASGERRRLEHLGTRTDSTGIVELRYSVAT